MGDKPGHPFRGNQYTAQSRAVLDYAKIAMTGTAPDLGHLARENKVPAKIRKDFVPPGEKKSGVREVLEAGASIIDDIMRTIEGSLPL